MTQQAIAQTPAFSQHFGEAERQVLTREVIDFLTELVSRFSVRRNQLLADRKAAQRRFEQVDWPAVQRAMKERIHLYDQHVGLVVEQLRCMARRRRDDPRFPIEVKRADQALLPGYARFEIAESFLTRSIGGCSAIAI